MPAKNTPTASATATAVTVTRLGPRSRRMVVIMLWLVGLLGGGLAGYVQLTTHTGWSISAIHVIAFPCMAIGALYALRRGKESLALNLFLWTMLVLMAGSAVTVAGVRTPGNVLFPVLIVLAGWLLSPRHGYVFTAIASAILLGLGMAEQAGWISYTIPRNPLMVGIIVSVYLLMAAVFSGITGTEIREENALSLALSDSLRQELENQRRSEQRFLALFRGNPLPAQINDAQGVIVDVNEAWTQTFGLSREQAIGKRPHDLALWCDLDDVRRIAEHLQGHSEMHNDPVRLHVAGGGERHFLVTVAAFETHADPLYACTLIDLTDRLAAEEAQRELNQTLEARVAERTAELTQTVARLRETQEELVSAEKLASLGAMVAGISHELNTPIGNAVTVASSLRERLAGFAQNVRDGQLKRSALDGFLVDATDMADLIERSSLRAGHLIASFKQVAVDQTSEQRRKFDLHTLAEDIVSTLRPGFKHQPWVVTIDIPAGITCDSYPGPLGQILTNLVQNAIAHAFDGRDHGNVLLSAVREGDTFVRLDVRDDGLGMDRGTQARIFDPFFTTKLGKGGSGLGLSICHRIAHSVLGGSLDVESAPGQGSCFSLRIPVNAPGRM